MQPTVKHLIKLDFILDIKNYRESFNKWLKVRSKILSAPQQNVQENEESFNRYLHVIVTSKLSEK